MMGAGIVIERISADMGNLYQTAVTASLDLGGSGSVVRREDQGHQCSGVTGDKRRGCGSGIQGIRRVRVLNTERRRPIGCRHAVVALDLDGDLDGKPILQ